MWNYLFSFRGRINRAKLWLFYLITLGVELLYLLLQQVLLADQPLAEGDGWHALLQPRLLAFAILCGAITIALLWSYVAVVIKRLHDRNRSGWWFLVFYVLPFAPLLPLALALPLLGDDLGKPAVNAALIACFLPACLLQMWGFVELYLLPGTTGDNRFGADPLAARPD